MTKCSMFGLFKKTRWKIEGNSLRFFKELLSVLPQKYDFLKRGIENGLYTGYFINYALNKENNFSVSFDPNQSDKSISKGIQFELKNIAIRTNHNEHWINLTIYDGLLIGFETNLELSKLDDFKIDISSLKEEKSKFATENRVLKKLVKGLSCEQLDLHDLSEIEINGKQYYQIKDLEDGNYLVVDDQGRVYGLIHDPYEIELINKSLKEFVATINAGEFRIESYLSDRLKNK